MVSSETKGGGRMKRFLTSAIVLLIAVSSSGCTGTPKQYERTQELFGTFVSARIYASDASSAEEALDAAFARAKALEQTFSPTIADSELNAVNASAFSQEIKVSEDFYTLLEQSLAYSKRSEGAFDCSIGELISLWGIGTEDARVPTEGEIRSTLHSSAHEVITQQDGAVRFLDDRVQLQFGAIAKGYIADEMKEALQAHGIESGTLSLGGNILTIGSKNGDVPWTIGITDPFAPQEITATVEVRDLSVVTSGNYERYFEENGSTYHHILNPKTGYPSDAGLISATIIAKSSLQCDALSTAVYVLGAQEGLALIESLDGAECVLITEDGTLQQSSGMDAYHLKQVEK